jgi:transposase
MAKTAKQVQPYPPEFRAEAIRRARTRGQSPAQIAQDLGMTSATLRWWLKQADLDAGKRQDGLTSDEQEELRRLRRLRRAVRIVREARAIRRQAAACFAREHDAIRSRSTRVWRASRPVIPSVACAGCWGSPRADAGRGGGASRLLAAAPTPNAPAPSPRCPRRAVAPTGPCGCRSRSGRVDGPAGTSASPGACARPGCGAAIAGGRGVGAPRAAMPRPPQRPIGSRGAVPHEHPIGAGWRLAPRCRPSTTAFFPGRCSSTASAGGWSAGRCQTSSLPR